MYDIFCWKNLFAVSFFQKVNDYLITYLPTFLLTYLLTYFTLFLDHHPFSKIPPFLEIEDIPIFHRFIRKTKVLDNPCNHFVYNSYPQSILVLEEFLQKW